MGTLHLEVRGTLNRLETCNLPRTVVRTDLGTLGALIKVVDEV